MNRTLTKPIIHLGWPVLVTQLATMANSVIDTVMAGHYSARALATVGLGSSIYFSIFIIQIARMPTSKSQLLVWG